MATGCISPRTLARQCNTRHRTMKVRCMQSEVGSWREVRSRRNAYGVLESRSTYNTPHVLFHCELEKYVSRIFRCVQIRGIGTHTTCVDDTLVHLGLRSYKLCCRTVLRHYIFNVLHFFARRAECRTGEADSTVCNTKSRGKPVSFLHPITFISAYFYAVRFAVLPDPSSGIHINASPPVPLAIPRLSAVLSDKSNLLPKNTKAFGGGATMLASANILKRPFSPSPPIQSKSTVESKFAESWLSIRLAQFCGVVQSLADVHGAVSFSPDLCIRITCPTFGMGSGQHILRIILDQRLTVD